MKDAQPITIKDLKKGDFFKLTENGRILIRGEYFRDSKKYSCHYADDYNHERLLKGEKQVITDFVY